MSNDRELRIKSETLECRHYTGTYREICSAGVNYRQHVGGPDLGWALKIPCQGITWTHAPGVERVQCDRYSPWTIEEATANIDAMDAAIENHMKAHRVTHDDAKKKGLMRGKGGFGECACPICTVGTILYSVSAYNGHLHGACTTDGCVKWME